MEPTPPGEHGKPAESHDSDFLGGLDVMGEDDHISPEMHGLLHGDGVVEAFGFLEGSAPMRRRQQFTVHL